MFDEDELLPLSALQHLAFCERQCMLIHLENEWTENRLTIEGHIFHERVDEAGTESVDGIRISRGLKIRSLRLGLSGQADVVEFHLINEMIQSKSISKKSDQNDVHKMIFYHGTTLPGIRGRWIPFPIEYKRGKPKIDHADEVQLCSQGLCLEEMLNVHVPTGALFYGLTRRRKDVDFTDLLRDETEMLTIRLHELMRIGKTPSPVYSRKCDQCSLVDICLPKTISGASKKVQNYLNDIITETDIL